MSEELTNPVWAALMDISLALLPWKILWGLEMRTAEKIGVCLAMSLGLLCVYLAQSYLEFVLTERRTGAASIVRSRYIELLATQDSSCKLAALDFL